METETREILERPFAKADIQKDYNGFDYVAPHLVVSRLNEAFGQDGWQFIPEERIEDVESITQFGKIGIKNEKGEWVWKQNCGGMARRYSSGKPHILENQINRVTDYKGAVSNCFKRCAMMLGVALDLYGDAEHDGGSQEPEADTITNIKQGEEELCVALKCSEADLRSEFFKTDTPLENVSAKEREDYLVHLRETRGFKTASVIGAISKIEAGLVKEKIVNEETGVSAMRKQAGLSDGTLD
jgi:hypothetical protein